MTRRDLPPAVQAVQSTHAAIDFVLKYPADALGWHKYSNYLGQLSCANEEELEKLMSKADQRGIVYVEFREPDLDNQLTAVCFEPTIETKKLLSSCPLMLKGL